MLQWPSSRVIPHQLQQYNRSPPHSDLISVPNDPVHPVNSCFTQIFKWRTKNSFFDTIFPWGCTEFAENSLSFPRSEKSLSIPGFPGLWLPCRIMHPRRATHLSTNPAGCRATWSMHTMMLPLSQTATIGVARLGEKAPIGLLWAAFRSLKFGFGALLHFWLF